ncbi:MAG: class I SAM-dependent methyltransferase [Streptosporangiaceae bacterium]
MIGELYERALAGLDEPVVEHPGGDTIPLAAQRWLQAAPGDDSLLGRCIGPTLDVGAGPGRLTIALAERGVPALAIDVTPYAVSLARSGGVLALQRDVFGYLPGTGRWATVLLADGNIGIGGDPAVLLRRSRGLLKPGGTIVAEIEPPGSQLRRECVRLRTPDRSGAWFPWAWVGADQIGALADSAALEIAHLWADAGRWFAELSRGCPDRP